MSISRVAREGAVGAGPIGAKAEEAGAKGTIVEAEGAGVRAKLKRKSRRKKSRCRAG